MSVCTPVCLYVRHMCMSVFVYVCLRSCACMSTRVYKHVCVSMFMSPMCSVCARVCVCVLAANAATAIAVGRVMKGVDALLLATNYCTNPSFAFSFSKIHVFFHQLLLSLSPSLSLSHNFKLCSVPVAQKRQNGCADTGGVGSDDGGGHQKVHRRCIFENRMQSTGTTHSYSLSFS